MPTAGNEGSRSRPVHGAISETLDRKNRVPCEAQQSCAGEWDGVCGSAVKCGEVREEFGRVQRGVLGSRWIVRGSAVECEKMMLGTGARSVLARRGGEPRERRRSCKGRKGEEKVRVM